MKRFSNLWPDVLDEQNAIDAVIRATKSKRGYRSVEPLLYSDTDDDPAHYHMIDPEKAREYVKPIIQELADHTWTHGEPRSMEQFCKANVPGGGKWRNLYVPSLKDHVV